MRRSFLLLGLLALFGCEHPMPVRGTAQDGETFTGVATATGPGSTTGTIEVTGDRGLKCSGPYVYADGTRGKADITCNNGESGEMRVETTGPGRGIVIGQLGRRDVIFTFGRSG